MNDLAAQVWRTLRLLLFAPHCQVCREPGCDPLCGPCLKTFVPLAAPLCPVCGDGVDMAGWCRECLEVRPQFDAALAPFVYEGALRRAVHLLKYRGRRVLAPSLGESLADFVSAGQPFPLPDAIVPVPLHSSRLTSRGFNQALLLAAPLALRLGVPLRPSWLHRIRPTLPQQAQDRTSRGNNVACAFVGSAAARGRRILLVDDVITTGETLDACASALRTGGAVEVYGIALARTLRHSRG